LTTSSVQKFNSFWNILYIIKTAQKVRDYENFNVAISKKRQLNTYFIEIYILETRLKAFL